MSRILKRLVGSLPEGIPVTRLRLEGVASRIEVADTAGRWDADSGQLALDFELAATPPSVRRIGAARASAVSARPTANEWFATGEELEPANPLAAEQAYREALKIEPHHPRAGLNLGALLCEAKRCGEAVELFMRVIEKHPNNALLHFNLAIALEDLRRFKEAVACYERCVTLDPQMADAYFNCARLFEQAGDTQKALRYFNAYRRLSLG